MNREQRQHDKKAERAVNRLMWQYHRRHKLRFGLLLVFMPLYFFLLNIMFPLLVAYGLQAIIHQQFQQVTHYVWLILLNSLGVNIALSVAMEMLNRNDVHDAADIQEYIVRDFLHKDYDFFANHLVGSLGSQAIDLRDAIIEHSRLFLYELPKLIVIMIAGLTVIALKSPLLAVVTASCVLVLVGFVVLFGRWRLKYRKILSETRSSLAGVVMDALSHGTTVKAFSNELYELKRLRGPLYAWRDAQYKTWQMFIPMNIGRATLLGVMMSALLLVSAEQYKSGAVSISIVLLVQLYVVRLLNVSVEVGDFVKAYDSMIASAQKPVLTMLEAVSVCDKPRVKPTPKRIMSISLESVGYHYPEAKQSEKAIKDFTLDIKQGEKIGIVGQSGSGKTTLTKLLMRYMDPTEGAVTFNGVPIADMAQKEVRRRIAYVPQEPLLFHRNIYENIAYANPGATKKQIEKVARISYVDEFAKRLPNGYETMVGERGIKLSGGQRQRVAIARALLKDAPLLVLDEATSALDSVSEQYIQKALWKLMRNRTTIVVAHRLSTIQRMDRIVVMSKGCIAEIGTHEELLAQNGVYAKLWAHQSGGYIGFI